MKISYRQVLSGLAVSFCLAIFITYISASGPRFDHRHEVIHNQLAILKGDPHITDGIYTEFPQFQSRVLFPLFLREISKVNIFTTSEWYILLRIFTAFLAFFAFFCVCMHWSNLDTNVVYLGVATLAYGLVFTFNHPWEHPTDFPDVFFYSLFIHFLLSKNRIFLLIAVLIGTLNHQTAAFAGIIWLVLYGMDSRQKPSVPDITYSIVLMGSSYVFSSLIRAMTVNELSPNYVINGFLTFEHFMEFLKHPNPYGWPIMLLAMHIPVFLWIYSQKSKFNYIQKRLMIAVAVIILISSPIAFWSEIRSVFLGPYVILSFLAAYIASSDPSTVEL